MKKIFLIIVSFVMILNFSLANMQEDCGRILVKMNLLAGYPDGTLKLENNITRAEFSVLVMKMLGFTNENIEISVYKDFKDLRENHWAYKSVMKATELGFLSGYEDATFRPSNTLTYAESCSILVNVLGYKSTLKGKWPTNVINKATELGINDNLSNKASSELMSRGEVAIMLINSLDIKIR